MATFFSLMLPVPVPRTSHVFAQCDYTKLEADELRRCRQCYMCVCCHHFWAAALKLYLYWNEKAEKFQSFLNVVFQRTHYIVACINFSHQYCSNRTILNCINSKVPTVSNTAFEQSRHILLKWTHPCRILHNNWIALLLFNQSWKILFICFNRISVERIYNWNFLSCMIFNSSCCFHFKVTKYHVVLFMDRVSCLPQNAPPQLSNQIYCSIWRVQDLTKLAEILHKLSWLIHGIAGFNRNLWLSSTSSCLFLILTSYNGKKVHNWLIPFNSNASRSILRLIKFCSIF